MSEKAIFFMYHNNDIDHMSPIIYKWLSTRSIETDVVLHGDHSFKNDYRIQFLDQFDQLNLHHIDDVLYGESRQQVNRLRTGFVTPRVKAVGRRLPTDIPRKSWHYLTGKVDTRYDRYRESVDELFDTLIGNRSDVVIAFDWRGTHSVPKSGAGTFADKVVREAGTRGIRTVSLPHGDTPYQNLLFKDERVEKVLSASRSEAHDMLELLFGSTPGVAYDHVVVPNQMTARRYQGWNDPEVVKTLGSPRYNREWVDKIDELAPQYQSDVSGKRKVVLFAGRPNFTVNLEELVRAIEIIIHFDEIHLVVQKHPRGYIDFERKFEKISKSSIDEIANLDIVGSEVQSSSLVRWGELIAHTGTSIAFEPVTRDQSVVSLEHTHSNRSTVGYYLENTRTETRDDLYQMFEAFLDRDELNTYTEDERDRFRQEMVSNRGEDVLGGYVEFLSGLM